MDEVCFSSPSGETAGAVRYINHGHVLLTFINETVSICVDYLFIYVYYLKPFLNHCFKNKATWFGILLPNGMTFKCVLCVH